MSVTNPLDELPRLGADAMAPCVICQRQLLSTELPIFFRVDAKQCGIDANDIRQTVGLATMIGGGNAALGLDLATVLGPRPKPVIVMDEISTFNVCHSCAMDRGLIDVIGHQWERDRVNKGRPVLTRDEGEG